ncbi:hypothetical protein LshimejAT787_1702660 [Lyophyllum shimeji]|uniref:Uncharacterized protein n=1 Tax=Lyophyllum shimeji TaxID=47721 RepID=A0A9P3Q035_LYOSH|nr:hypothetical protein LshimejAT787_1702660 [Lyophyllum shimeji]
MVAGRIQAGHSRSHRPYAPVPRCPMPATPPIKLTPQRVIMHTAGRPRWRDRAPYMSFPSPGPGQGASRGRQEDGRWTMDDDGMDQGWKAEGWTGFVDAGGCGVETGRHICVSSPQLGPGQGASRGRQEDGRWTMDDDGMDQGWKAEGLDGGRRCGRLRCRDRAPYMCFVSSARSGQGASRGRQEGGRWTMDDGRWTMDDGRWTTMDQGWKAEGWTGVVDAGGCGVETGRHMFGSSPQLGPGMGHYEDDWTTGRLDDWTTGRRPGHEDGRRTREDGDGAETEHGNLPVAERDAEVTTKTFPANFIYFLDTDFFTYIHGL